MTNKRNLMLHLYYLEKVNTSKNYDKHNYSVVHNVTKLHRKVHNKSYIVRFKIYKFYL